LNISQPSTYQTWDPISPPPPERLRTPNRRNWFPLGRALAGGILFAAALSLLASVALGIVPIFMGMRPFIVISGSMEPTIHTGSVVVTRPIPSVQLKVGDIIAFNPRAEAALPIVHRIVALENRKGQSYAITRGDANNADDAEIALGPTSLHVANAIPLIGFAAYYAAQPWGTVIFVWIPSGLLAALWIKDQVTHLRQGRRIIQ
jgi:signal peptidase